MVLYIRISPRRNISNGPNIVWRYLSGLHIKLQEYGWAWQTETIVGDGGKTCMAALQAPDRVWQEKHGNGRRRKLLVSAYVHQPGSPAHRSSDVNAAKHRSRQTDVHTFPLTVHISACQTGSRRSGEGTMAKQEKSDSSSMLLTTRWMSQYLRELQFHLPIY